MTPEEQKLFDRAEKVYDRAKALLQIFYKRGADETPIREQGIALVATIIKELDKEKSNEDNQNN